MAHAPTRRVSESRACAGQRPRAASVVVADAGYWHHEQMDRLAADGIALLTPPDANRRTAPAGAGTAAAMNECAGCSPPSSASGSTDNDHGRSSRSSDTKHN